MAYKSKFEEDFQKAFPDAKYELKKFKYSKTHTYTPDWELGDKIVETKGRFTVFDRSKILAVLEQNPDLKEKFIIVFQNPFVKINKKSKTSYSDWCDKHNIKWTTLEKLKIK